MSEVTLVIGRRNYAVACSPGQEDHVRAMGREVDDRLRRLGTNVSTNDAKNLLFAALILADELFELRRETEHNPQVADAGALVQLGSRVAELEEELADARDERERLEQHLANANERLARAEDREVPVTNDIAALAEQLDGIAAMLEKSASILENGSKEA